MSGDSADRKGTKRKLDGSLADAESHAHQYACFHPIVTCAGVGA